MRSTQRERDPLLPTTSFNSKPPPPSHDDIASTSSDTTPLSEEAGTSLALGMGFGRQSQRSRWIIFAVASGACAALNGVFAKLTTTEITTNFALSIVKALGLGGGEKVVEFVIRGMFFALNLIFNGIMWTIFTKALTAGTSATQVSIINTSSNFMITAMLSFFIFTESLPPLWWLGATLLVAGNVIIGRREEQDTGVLGPTSVVGEGELQAGQEEDDGLFGAFGSQEEISVDVDLEGNFKRDRRDSYNDDVDDILDLEMERVKLEDEHPPR